MLARTWRAFARSASTSTSPLRRCSTAARGSCQDGSWWYGEDRHVPLDRQFSHRIQPGQPQVLYRELWRRARIETHMLRGLEFYKRHFLRERRLPAVLPQPHAADRQPVRRAGHRDAGATFPTSTPRRCSIWPSASPRGRSGTCRTRTGTSTTACIPRSRRRPRCCIGHRPPHIGRWRCCGRGSHSSSGSFIVLAGSHVSNGHFRWRAANARPTNEWFVDVDESRGRDQPVEERPAMVGWISSRSGSGCRRSRRTSPITASPKLLPPCH